MLIPHDVEKILVDLSDFSIIVEGKRDKKALEGLGINNIFVISGKPLENFVDNLPKDRKYIILTDFDEEGEHIKTNLSKLLLKNKFVVNEKIRQRFKNLFNVSKVEELNRILKLKEDVYNGKISSINYKIFNRSKFYRK